MKALFLDEFVEGSATCYLCKMSLEEYITHLPSSFHEYEIQREIVVNAYLDKLVGTILEKRHIPPMVLIADKITRSGKDGKEIAIANFKILDGLQRTYRLKAIRETINIVATIKDLREAQNSSAIKLSREYSQELKKIHSNTQILAALIQSGVTTPQNFSTNYQWFEVWTGLTDDDAIRKMLLLNAGHKPVKPKHQLELLFLHLKPKFDLDVKDFELVREKEHSAVTFSKSRKPGQFHFAHIIAALLSFVDGKPVTTNPALLQDIQSDDEAMDTYMETFTAKFLRAFVECLVTIDKQIRTHFEDQGVKWLGREVSLSALFGALGMYATTNKLGPDKAISFLKSFIVDNTKVLNLKDYEAKRNNMDLSKVNFGKVNKDAIFDAIKEVLFQKNPRTIDWSKFLPQDQK